MLPRNILTIYIPDDVLIPSIEIQEDEADWMFLAGLRLHIGSVANPREGTEWVDAIDRFLHLTENEADATVDGEAVLAIIILLHRYAGDPSVFSQRLPGAREHSGEAALGLSDFFQGEIEGVLIRQNKGKEAKQLVNRKR